MRNSIVAAALCLLAAAPLAAQSWDDPAWYAAPAAPLDLTLTADPDRAARARIGPAGGRVTAEGANGDTYALTIPEGALFTETEITVVPVAAAAGLPEGAGPFAGVILEPEGLELARTGRLEITPAAPIPPASRALWGFYGTGQDARGEIGLRDAGDRIVIPLDHFSGAGVSIADRINLQLDRWRQRFLEDRVRTQVAEATRRHRATGDATAVTEALGRETQRIVAHGWRNLATRPGATCADVAEAARGFTGIARSVGLMGIEIDIDIRKELGLIFDRYWAACFPEEVQTCLRTGDLHGLVRFAASLERQRQLIGLSSAEDAVTGGHEGELRAALERCGRFKLEVEASGRWRDPSDVAGQIAFRADVPLRLTFLQPKGFDYLIEGEAPATGVTVSFADPECWRFHGHLNGKAMLARITTYEFSADEAQRPLKLELRATAPEVLADIECDGYRMQPPMSPMVWAVAHRADRNGEVFRLARFQPAQHPVLFQMEWQGEDTDDGLHAADTTRLRLVHIAQ